MKPAEGDVEKDILCALLGEVGFESFETTETGVLAYIDKALFSESAVEDCLAQYPFESVTGWQSEDIANEDWNAEWEKTGFEPQYIGDCVIYGRQHVVEPRPYMIEINPRQAFGSGHHETTTMMVKWLLQAPLRGAKLLDMGTGTGVLAILASKLGVSHAWAVEIDSGAWANACENAAANGVENVEIMLGDAQRLREIPANSCDVVLANINRNILLADMAQYVRCLKLGGWLVLSGFYSEDIPVLEQCANGLGLRLDCTHSENEWCQMVLKKVE